MIIISSAVAELNKFLWGNWSRAVRNCQTGHHCSAPGTSCWGKKSDIPHKGGWVTNNLARAKRSKQSDNQGTFQGTIPWRDHIPTDRCQGAAQAQCNQQLLISPPRRGKIFINTFNTHLCYFYFLQGPLDYKCCKVCSTWRRTWSWRNILEWLPSMTM